MVRPMPGRRRRSVLAGVAEAVRPVDHVAATLGEPARVAGNAIGDPVGEAVDERSVGIVDHDGERPGAGRDPGPLQRRRDVISVAAVRAGIAPCGASGSRGRTARSTSPGDCLGISRAGRCGRRRASVRRGAGHRSPMRSQRASLARRDGVAAGPRSRGLRLQTTSVCCGDAVLHHVPCDPAVRRTLAAAAPPREAQARRTCRSRRFAHDPRLREIAVLADDRFEILGPASGPSPRSPTGRPTNCPPPARSSARGR
jgi:hypothetical protein